MNYKTQTPQTIKQQPPSANRATLLQLSPQNTPSSLNRPSHSTATKHIHTLTILRTQPQTPKKVPFFFSSPTKPRPRALFNFYPIFKYRNTQKKGTEKGVEREYLYSIHIYVVANETTIRGSSRKNASYITYVYCLTRVLVGWSYITLYFLMVLM